MANTFYDFYYDGTFEGLMCVLVRCINMRVRPHNIKTEYMADAILTANSMLINTDGRIADRFYRYLGDKSGILAQQMVKDCFLTDLQDREIAIYYLVYRLLKNGPSVCDNYEDEFIRRIHLAIRDLYREGQYIASEIRYILIRSVSVAVINPKNNILPIIRNTISHNPNIDDYMVYDARHRILQMRLGENDSTLDISAIPGLIPSSATVTADEIYNTMWNYFAYGGRMVNLSRRRRRGEIDHMWDIAI